MSRSVGPFRTTGWGPFALPWERRLLRELEAERELIDDDEDAINGDLDGAARGGVEHGQSTQPVASKHPLSGSESVQRVETKLDSAAKASDEPVFSTGSVTSRLVVLVVDHEDASREETVRMLENDSRVGVALEAADGAEALRIVNEYADLGSEAAHSAAEARSWDRGLLSIDVVFLDIRTPDLDGVELAQTFSAMAVPPSVVFVTAREDRAVEAYEVGAVDYLLKPVRAERLSATLDRILGRRATADIEPLPEHGGEDEVIPVELAGGTTKLLQRSAVRYVEAQGDYSRLHTHEGSHFVRIPLSVLEDRWRDVGFVRIHRHFLVSMALVTDLRLSGSGYVVRVGNGPAGAELPVSRRYTRELKERLVRVTNMTWSRQ